MTLELASAKLELAHAERDFEVLVIEDEDLMSALILRYIEGAIIPLLPQKPKLRILDRGWDLLQSDLSNVRVAVVDLLLPQVTGIDLIKNFRSRYPHMGIVPISGMATEPMRRNLSEILHGDFGLIEKPLRKETFKTAFMKAWNFWSPPTPASQQTKMEGEPSWNSVSSDRSNNGVTVEKRKLPQRPSDSDETSDQDPEEK